MSYQVLARKWRPRNFATLVGQEHVVRALNHALTEQRLHHAYLFTGTRGVGKTTIARILAKSLNCETGITPTPCGVCSACREIDAARFVDLMEVDAATNTKVDEMRQLLDNAVYAPTRGRFKVYVIDEVHMLSNSAFNSMLKTLEEPPAHVKFILATTDPQKIPVTVLSRCLQFNLKQMTEPAIVKHLGQILSSENISHDENALFLIARAAAGSMRDALSLLDQAIAHGSGRVETDQVRGMLGVIGNEYMFAIVEALSSGDAAELIRLASDIAARSLSFNSALQELAALFTRLQVIQAVPTIQDDSDPDAKRIEAVSRLFTPDFFHLAYQIAIHGRNELHLAPDEYSGFVMTLLRLQAFRPESVSDFLGAHPSKRIATATGEVIGKRKSDPEQHIEAQRPQASDIPNEARPVGWAQIVSALPLSGLARELAQNCELSEMTEDLCVLRLPATHAHLESAGLAKLKQALSTFFGRSMQIRINLGDTLNTPAQAIKSQNKQVQDAALDAVDKDQFIRDAIDLLGAKVVDSSIRPIELKE